MPARSIEEYISEAPPRARALMEQLHDCLTAVAPAAEQGIKWSAPAFTQKRLLFQFAAHKNYVSFYPTPAVIDAFASELDGFERTASSLKLPLDDPLPKALITRMAKLRLKEVVENDAKWM